MQDELSSKIWVAAGVNDIVLEKELFSVALMMLWL